jgi:hypothetical protein
MSSRTYVLWKFFLSATLAVSTMDWKNAGAELPPQWKAAVSARNRELLGKRGLGRFAWCVAAEVLLALPTDVLHELAAKLRLEAERDWESFANKWSDRDKAARRAGADLLAAVLKALEPAARRASKRA